MKTANFSDFRRHATEFLDEVEKGESLRMLRHGKPVADLTPILQGRKPSWKNAPPQIPLNGISLAKAILQNRKDAVR